MAKAGFGHLVIDDRPEEARAALGAIETTGREALGEMRRLLGVLPEEPKDGETCEPALVPCPGLAGLDRLLASTAIAGLHVELMVTGSPQPLPAGVDVSAYRIVQEAGWSWQTTRPWSGRPCAASSGPRRTSRWSPRSTPAPQPSRRPGLSTPMSC
ncbi:sensor histidine kinase [Actinacidiphila paucisporea]|uniref:sensor histidine kinase n=1 Tax=Actinacidiphila paucisporea TaxID=310782 RepID=UPI00389909E5